MVFRRKTEAAETPEVVQEPVVAAAPEPVAAAPEPVAAAPEPVAAAHVPAVRPAAAPVAMGSRSRVKMTKLFEDMENMFVAEYGMLPRLKASNGNFIEGENTLLGDFITCELLSWNRQYVVGPCENKAPADLVKYSYDRDWFSDGSGSLEDYVKELKVAGWPNAAVKEYYELVVNLTNAAKPHVAIGQMISLQLAPTSVKEFEGYRLQRSFFVFKNAADESMMHDMLAASAAIKITTEVVSAKGNTWTKMKFAAAE